MVQLAGSPDLELVAVLREAAQRHSGGCARIAVAWARESGVHWLLNAFDGHIPNINVVAGLNEHGTTAEALLYLREQAQSLWVYFKHPYQTFHPKLYLITSQNGGTQQYTAIVGSSNLTHGGLTTNFELSVVVTEDQTVDHGLILYQALEDYWDSLVGSPYAHRIVSEDQIRQLFNDGVIPREAGVRGRRRSTASRDPHGLISAPPPRRVVPVAHRIAVPFDAEPTAAPDDDQDPIGAVPLPKRFYVRTLTANDIEKLVNRRVGTFEPDLGQTARDVFPAFWCWPNNYVASTTGLARRQWSTNAVLRSSAAPEGVDINLTLWFRPARPDHAAEHRITLTPIGLVRDAVPNGFDTTSLMVITKAPEGDAHDFDVDLIVRGDQRYNDYSSYLTERRPAHRYGYGPLDAGPP